jgi:hypothetical protein
LVKNGTIPASSALKLIGIGGSGIFRWPPPTTGRAGPHPAVQMVEVMGQALEVPGGRIRTGGSASTGLGLAVVRAIVTAHSGKIDVRSEENRGARFRILLPRQSVEAG